MKKNNQMIYKRDKNKVEISGESDEVKWPMWFDLISTRLFWVVLVVILLCTVPQHSWIPIVWQWVKRQIPLLTLFVVAANFLMVLLSG